MLPKPRVPLFFCVSRKSGQPLKFNYTENKSKKNGPALSFKSENTMCLPSLEDQLQQVTELISLPEIYLKINRLMDDPTADIDDFAQVIKLDPNLSAKLLKAVNSAYYGFSGEINSISRAVNMLGIQQLHFMVLSISAVTAVASLQFPKDIVDLKAFWRSSLLSGTLSRQLAQLLKIRPSERFFILGLLHEIGHLVLYANFPDLARQSIQLARDNSLPIHQAEKEVIGCHYGNIGAMLMHHWKLPESFQILTKYQPTPGLSPNDPSETALLHIAHGYAHKQCVDNEKEIEDLIDTTAWGALDLTDDMIVDTLETALIMSNEMEKVIFR